MASTLANESRSVRHKQPTSTPMQADAYKQDMTQLVEQYLPLVKSHVSKIRPFFPETTATEDLYSLALKGLITAINQYKPDKNTTLGGYASILKRGIAFCTTGINCHITLITSICCHNKICFL